MPHIRVRTDFFRLTDPSLRQAYDALFEGCPHALIQQSTWWAEVITELGPDEAWFALAWIGDKPVAGLPLYLFKGSLGNVFTSVPQAGPLGGVFHAPHLDADERESCVAALMTRALSAAEEHQCLSLSVITDPFQPEADAYAKVLQPHYRFRNFTQWTDLRTFFTEEGTIAFADYHRRSNLSRNLAKARAAGLSARLTRDPAEIDALYAIHLKRHAELGAPPLDRRLIRNIADVLLARGKAFVVVVESGDRVASWGVYLHHHRVLDVLRLNMDSDFVDACPNYLNTDYSLRIARNLGITHYNWQSAPSRSSGVYRYKTQWAASELPYAYLTKLFCPPTLLAEAGREKLQRDYPLHFIAPYAAAEAGFAPGVYGKD